ncbi:hypothetical protein APT65_00127 [Trabzonvirus APT65]|uniref:DUF3307 domain-containing protein n=1 Tax=Aeromonas phage APT65 TaxID=2982914 RepID=A0A9E8GHW9_9CAUD|nr:hypothetical protein APT65_00127 [Aeromonas phage APT65]
MTSFDLPMMLLSTLVLKHFVFDFAYQPPYQWRNKGTYGHMGGIQHSGFHSIATCIILLIYPVPIEKVLVLVLFEFIAHYHIDWAKMSINKKMGWKADTHEEFWILLGFDQLLHIQCYIFIVLVAL